MADWCCLCKSDGESVSHPLLHFPIAWPVDIFILPSSNRLGHAKLCYAHGFKNRYGQRTGFGPNSRFYLVLISFIQVLGILPDRIGAWFPIELVSPVWFLKQWLCLCWSLGKEPSVPLDSRKWGVPFLPCLMLRIWTEKSQPTFKWKELTLPNFKFMFLKTLYEWSSKSYTF